MIEENITGGIPGTRQTALVKVINYLECWLQNSSFDVTWFRNEIESPSPWNTHPNFQSHTKMLLAEALHEVDCLSVVIAKLKWELGFEECEECEPEAEQEEKDHSTEKEDAEVDDMLAAIRKRRAEDRQQQAA
jgi:hypothetical protein